MGPSLRLNPGEKAVDRHPSLGFPGIRNGKAILLHDHLPGGVMLVPEGSGLIERVAFD